jgi:Nif-specific regulatory protein
LEALAGPLQGRTFPLEGDLSLGRAPTNDIPLLDSLVSRHHCIIHSAAGVVRVEDLESRNCTFVNGLPVKDRDLLPGDQIRVGSSVFVLAAADLAPAVRVELSCDPTIVLSKEDAVYLRPGAQLPADRRTVQDLDALLRLSVAAGSVRGRKELAQTTLEAVLDIVPADRAAILLMDDELDELSCVLGWSRHAGRFQLRIAASRTILSRVMSDRIAVLSNDIPADPEFEQAESIAVEKLRAVLAVPIEFNDRVAGVLYLDSSSTATAFDDRHLQLVTAIGNIAGLAFENLWRIEFLEGENRRLHEDLRIEHDMVGASEPIKAVYRFISRVAASESTVLVFGESGTGKELVARAIHNNSPRARMPFVAINCAAIAENLLESELFGHEKGAFTGAVTQKKGKFETANGGTVFLDEIGELAPALQAKLLRVLQEREFERVGGTRPIKLDIRLVAATNRDLNEASKTGSFRSDLYYRLNVVSVKMPALRDRRPDIHLLAAHFVNRISARLNRRISGISPKALACLTRYDWPGNVRELENAIERALVLGSTEFILPEDLPETILEVAQAETAAPMALHAGLLQAKREMIQRAIEEAGGNYTEAAGKLGVHPNHLFRLIRSLNMKPKRQQS